MFGGKTTPWHGIDHSSLSSYPIIKFDSSFWSTHRVLQTYVLILVFYWELIKWHSAESRGGQMEPARVPSSAVDAPPTIHWLQPHTQSQNERTYSCAHFYIFFLEWGYVSVIWTQKNWNDHRKCDFYTQNQPKSAKSENILFHGLPNRFLDISSNTCPFSIKSWGN